MTSRQKLIEKLNQMSQIQNQIEYLNDKKMKLKQDLEKMIDDQGLMGKKLNLGQRSYCYKKKTVNEGLSQKMLSDSLLKYFRDEKKSKDLMEYILNQRGKRSYYSLEIKDRT